MVSTVSPFTTSLPDAGAVAGLRSSLQGNVFLPGEEGYAVAVTAWAALVRHTPDIVVMPETVHDVARAVAFAHEFDLPVAVQGTGHGMPVPCTEGMLINTSRMQRVVIYPEWRMARVEAGATWEHVIPLAHAHGLAPLNGSSSSVGVVGYTLGGGHGWMARKYGRAADRLVAADVVTADGRLLHVSNDSHPELFWALKGGSGNFGIVTALEFELVPVDTIFGGAVLYPIADAPRVFEAFSSWTDTLPEDITASIALVRLPPMPDLPPMLQGVQAVVIRACAVGDLRAGEATIAPMRELGTTIMDTFCEMPYTAIDAISMDPKDPMPAFATAMALNDLDDATISSLLACAGPGVDSPLLSIEIRDYRRTGPKGISRGAGAFEGLSLFAVGVPVNPEVGSALHCALGGLHDAMRPHMAERVLLNFLGDGDLGPERTRAAFATDDFARLQEVKRRYDPQNRFRFNHNIPPAE